jgi:DNA helicase-2/ATP-dependent DNA helicase PcrA
LFKPVRLLEQNPDLLKEARNRFSHIFIDEFQDINLTQYTLLKRLCQPNRPIFAVGDDDQSIYGWRGANLASILKFDEDFQGAQVFRLEQNYRSTKVILDAANGVIKKNTMRHAKTLWTENVKGAPIQIMEALDEFEEGRMVAGTIQNLIKEGVKPQEVAVLFRTNAQSRSLEEALLAFDIPYLIVGGVKFYQRKEIKDFLAYLKFLANPLDTLSLYRLAQTPSKGIGEATLRKLTALKGRLSLDYLEILSDPKALLDFKGLAKKLLNLGVRIQGMKSALERAPSLSEGLLSVLEESGLKEDLLKKSDKDSKERVENLYELISLARSLEAAQGGMELQDYLDHVALMTDLDTADSASSHVLLMTLHQAKGLEFSFVFLVGLEDNLLPHSLCKDMPSQIEEERRLFYVGVTRAKEELFLSMCRYRYGPMGKEPREPSPFLEGIPKDLTETLPLVQTGWLTTFIKKSRFKEPS